MRYSEQDVVVLFQQAIWEVCQKRLDHLHPETRMSDIGLDSVVTLEVMGWLEEQLHIHIPDERFARVETLRDLSLAINQILAEA